MKTTRHLTQFAFVVFTIVAVFVVGGHTERWCPFGGVEALYSYVTVGDMTCSLGVSNFFILGAVLLMVLLLRRAFCGYVCPIGAISEWLRIGGRRVGIREVRVPGGVDRALSMLKYPFLVIILYFTWQTGELIFRGFDPCYALISRHGKDITFWAYVVSGAIVLASLLIMLPFCRWLCPLAAIFDPISRFGLTRVRRHADSCVDCGVCQRVCPMNIPVDRVREVTHGRCTSCLDCVAACPKGADGALTWGPPARLGRPWPQFALIGIVLACIGGAVAATYALPLPSFVATRGEAPAETATLSMRVKGIACRGTSQSFVNWLEGDEFVTIPGYVKVETWPDPGWARVRITYDPAQSSADEIRRLIISPRFDLDAGELLVSPYEIEGYTPNVDDL